MHTIDDIFLIPILNKGDKLFHYTSAAGFQGICNGEFWVTESNFLNDITEFHVATDVFCEVIDRHIHNKTVCEKLKQKIIDEIKRINRCPAVGEEVAYSGAYVISFSLDYDSTLMWSEYSNFFGYALTFDFEKLLSSFNDQSDIQHGKVIYDHEEQIHLIEQTIENSFINLSTEFEYLNSWEDFDTLSDEEINDLYLFLALIIDGYNEFFKLPCFKGENEYRFIFYCGHEGGRYKQEQLEKQYFRIKDENLIPFVKKRMINMESLEEVLIGPKNKSDIAVLGAERLLRNLDLSVPVVRSSMPLRY